MARKVNPASMSLMHSPLSARKRDVSEGNEGDRDKHAQGNDVVSYVLHLVINVILILGSGPTIVIAIARFLHFVLFPIFEALFLLFILSYISMNCPCHVARNHLMSVSRPTNHLVRIC